MIFVKCHSELLNVQLVLAGDAFASQFGYALAAVDVNNDGFTDLFVSAPFYHSRKDYNHFIIISFIILIIFLLLFHSYSHNSYIAKFMNEPHPFNCLKNTVIKRFIKIEFNI